MKSSGEFSSCRFLLAFPAMAIAFLAFSAAWGTLLAAQPPVPCHVNIPHLCSSDPPPEGDWTVGCADSTNLCGFSGGAWRCSVTGTAFEANGVWFHTADNVNGNGGRELDSNVVYCMSVSSCYCHEDFAGQPCRITTVTLYRPTGSIFSSGAGCVNAGFGGED